MELVALKDNENVRGDIKLNSIYTQFGELIKEVEKKELTPKIIESVNKDVEEINSTSLTGKELRNLVKQKQNRILEQLGKEMKVVPKNHYRNLWLVLGMSAFGLPIGLAVGLAVGNIGLLAIGLPIGMGIGVAVGSAMDKKAFSEGRQLEIEIK